MILSSYMLGSLLKEEYQKLELYARKAEEMSCNIFFPGSAVCACGKNLYSPPGSEFLTRDLIPIGELNRAIDVQVRRDNPHSGINEEHIKRVQGRGMRKVAMPSRTAIFTSSS